LLRQPLNFSAVGDATWSIYTVKENEGQLRFYMPSDMPVEISITDMSGGISNVLHRCLIAEAKKCFEQKATSIIAPPDSFWGDGSLPNLIAVAGQRADLCVAAPHVRVEEAPFLQALPDGVLTNPQLVTLSLKVLHRVWRECNPDEPFTNTQESGHTLRKLPTPGHYSVCHLLPTPYLARFTLADIKFMESAEGDSWDHRWPTILTETARQRVIGSSDGFFMAELTNPDTHAPPVKPRAEFEDHFGSDHPHNKINRNMISIWRAA
jgi:hypothetical protein